MTERKHERFQTEPRASAARYAVLIVLAAAVMFLPSWAARDLWTPDEPRYMEVAREMAITGNYLVPHLNGEPYPDKPPLFFWLAAGFYKLGVGLNSGRLLAALGVVGALLLTYRFALRFLDESAAVLAALATLTTYLFVECRAGVLDPVLAFFVVGALLLGYRALQPETRRRGAYWLGAYALAAMGCLTKGPVGVLHPGLVLLVYGLLNRRRVRPGGWWHLAGAGGFVALVAAWVVPAVLAAGEAYRDNLLFRQNLARVVRSYSHRQPFHFFLVRYPLSFFPWSVLFPLALIAAVLAWWRARDDKALLMACWFGVVFVFHSLISCKRAGYLVPIAPAVGLGVGWYAANGLRHGFPWPRWHRSLAAVSCALIGLVGAFAAVGPLIVSGVVSRSPKPAAFLCAVVAELTPWTYVSSALAGVLILGVAAWGFVLAVRHRTPGRVFGLLVALVLIISLYLDGVVTPPLNRVKSGRFFSELAAPYLRQADRVRLLRNDMSGVYNLYTGRLAMPVLLEAEDVRRALAQGGKLAIIAREHRWERMTRELDTTGCRVVVRRLVSSRPMVLIVNWKPQGQKAATAS